MWKILRKLTPSWYSKLTPHFCKPDFADFLGKNHFALAWSSMKRKAFLTLSSHSWNSPRWDRKSAYKANLEAIYAGLYMLPDFSFSPAGSSSSRGSLSSGNSTLLMISSKFHLHYGFHRIFTFFPLWCVLFDLKTHHRFTTPFKIRTCIKKVIPGVLPFLFATIGRMLYEGHQSALTPVSCIRHLSLYRDFSPPWIFPYSHHFSFYLLADCLRVRFWKGPFWQCVFYRSLPWQLWRKHHRYELLWYSPLCHTCN